MRALSLDLARTNAVRFTRATESDPVREMTDDGETGRLAGLLDAEEFASCALEVLGDPKAHRAVGDRAAVMIGGRDALSVTQPTLVARLDRAAIGR
jgi:hypothetical protein